MVCLTACGTSAGSAQTGQTADSAAAAQTQVQKEYSADSRSTEAAAVVDTVGLDDNNVAIFDECTARIDKVSLAADGRLRVQFTFTNLGTSSMYMYESFSVSVMQGGNTLKDVTDINNGPAQEKAVLTQVKDGQSVSCTYVFEGASKGQVMIDICEPTADQALLIEHMYKLSKYAD